MAKGVGVARKNVLVEEAKVQRLVTALGATSESEAIRVVIDDRLFADEVMARIHNLRRRGTVRDAYRRATRPEDSLR